MEEFDDEDKRLREDLSFKTKDMLAFRQQAYQQVFNPESSFVKEVMKDLVKFCRAESTTFHADPRIHAVLEGRRETYLRIQQHLNKPIDELLKLLGGY